MIPLPVFAGDRDQAAQGRSSPRRRLSLADNLSIAEYDAFLPEKAKQYDQSWHVKDENHLPESRSRPSKGGASATAPNVDFIKKILDDAYSSGITYDVSDIGML